MIYRLLADAVVLLHGAFVIFVVAGGIAVVFRPKVGWLHIPIVLWGALIEFSGWICPLTPLENWLRHKGGQAGYPGGFIEQYFLPILYPEDLSRSLQFILGTAVIIINLLVYTAVIHRRRQRTRGAEPGAEDSDQ